MENEKPKDEVTKPTEPADPAVLQSRLDSLEDKMQGFFDGMKEVAETVQDLQKQQLAQAGYVPQPQPQPTPEQPPIPEGQPAQQPGVPGQLDMAGLAAMMSMFKGGEQQHMYHPAESYLGRLLMEKTADRFAKEMFPKRSHVKGVHIHGHK